MASPRKLISNLTCLSPRRAESISNLRQFLSPQIQTKNNICNNKIYNKNQLSPFNIDTPNKTKILNDGLPHKHYAVLGTGGFSTVYKAFYKGTEVAAKVIENRNHNDIINSEKHASQLRHSNIIKILNIEQGASLALITMELCNVTLQDRLEEQALTSKEQINIWKGVASALQFCHTAGVIHADIKPKNILIDTNGLPKLTDFGNSILVKERCNYLKSYGTPGYAAPEVLQGNIPTFAADIYSLGITAWEMLSRKAPFNGLHIHTIIYLSAKGIRPKDTDLDDGFDGKYKTLYHDMWSQDITDRPSLPEIIHKLTILIT